MVNLSISIIIAVVCIIIGLGLGMIISMAFSGRSGDTKKAANNPDGPYKRVVVILRDPRDGNLLTEIDGRIHASTEPLNDSQREMLEKTARDMYAWLRMPPEPELPKTLEARPAAEEKKTVPLAGISKSAEMKRPEPVKKAAGMVPPLVAAAVASNVEKGKPPAPPKSIVEQIDEILQDLVAGTPLAEKSIKLVEEPDHDVIVWIGTDHYEGINNVPDIEARTIIQAAVREWEKQSETSRNNRPY